MLASDLPGKGSLEVEHREHSKDQLGARIENLPIQPTPLIGRGQEVEAVCTLLRRPEVRLLVLTGTGGVGKTRLSLQVATELCEDFADGICFVPLAAIRDSVLVVPAITQTLKLKEVDDQPVLNLLKAYLQDKHLLLLLDNFEQVLAAAPTLSHLLVGCPHLKIIVTSRAVLHVYGNAIGVPVPPIERAGYERAVASARVHLGEQAFARAWIQGQTSTPEEALALQGREPTAPTPLLTTPPVTTTVSHSSAYPDGLTAREVEVLQLLARGLTDFQIAEKLVLSSRTVHSHISSIYRKLAITSRSAATRYAIEHHIA